MHNIKLFSTHLSKKDRDAGQRPRGDKENTQINSLTSVQFLIKCIF